MKDTTKKTNFSSLFLLLFLSSSLLFLFVLSILTHELAGAAKARCDCAISEMFTSPASFWDYFPQEHFPSHYSAFPLQQYAVFNLPLAILFLCLKSDCNSFRISFGPSVYTFFKHALKVHFGNWSGQREKKRSSSRKHLDNCCLLHKKQLEVKRINGKEEGRARWRGKSALCEGKRAAQPSCAPGGKKRSRRAMEAEGGWSWDFLEKLSLIKTI